MIIKTHPLPVKRQAELLEISRANVYYLPASTSERDLALMRAIDELHLEYPFLGARQLRTILAREGHLHAGRLHIGTLMEKMGITALYRKPHTSKRHPAHKVYPYLLRHLAIERANHVWAMDITYLPMQRGFIYLAAVMDWATRRVLAWRVSNTLTADFCIEAVEEAIGRYGKPEIFNTDQGTQFTSDGFTTMLHDHGVAISMDGRGCWRDNVFVERLWRSIKYEEVYLHAYANVSAAKAGVGRYLEFYNGRRPHTALGDRTPDEAYFTQQTLKNAA
jgi:putative transposase